jgi:hypothetical protein
MNRKFEITTKCPTLGQMSFDEFRRSIAAGASVPPGLSAPLLALWHDGRGDWDEAHAAAQSDPGPAGAWVHAYLHRKEGDVGNAGYWYRRAGKPVPPTEKSFEEEWTEIAKELVGR